jgi:hypothetical protein
MCPTVIECSFNGEFYKGEGFENGTRSRFLTFSNTRVCRNVQCGLTPYRLLGANGMENNHGA